MDSFSDEVGTSRRASRSQSDYPSRACQQNRVGGNVEKA